MTQEQIYTLAKMPVTDRIKKYLPYLRGKQITTEQYAYILRLKTEIPRAETTEDGSYLGQADRSPETPGEPLDRASPSQPENRGDPQEMSLESFVESFTQRAVSGTPNDVATVERHAVGEDYSGVNGNVGGDAEILSGGNAVGRDTQKGRILGLLSDGKPHTTVEIMQRAYKIEEEKAGNCRIPSRINDLRKEGYNIPKARHVKGGVWEYQLIT